MRQSRNEYLDGLRGYAALSVLIFHSILMLSPNLASEVLPVPIYQIKDSYLKITKFFLLVFNGPTAVNIFFVLSGMVLFHSLLKGSRVPIITFSLRRVIRIYMPLIPCLLVFYVVFNVLHSFFPILYSHIKLKALIANCLLYKITIHGATWTLKSEIIAIPAILLTYYLYVKWGMKSLFFLTALSILALDNDLKINFSSTNTWLYYFYLGFLCAVFQDSAKDFSRKLGWLLPLCIVLLLRGGLVNNATITSNLLQGLSIAALILHLSNDPNSKFSAFLKLPFSQYLGKISFSFYLWNVIALNLFIPLARVPSIAQHPLEFGLLIGFVTFLLTLPMAHYSEQFIEQPAIRLGKMLSERVLLIPFQIRMAIANE